MQCCKTVSSTWVAATFKVFMKLSVAELRQVIREEFMRGVPEWALRQATSEYVEEIRQHIKHYILTVKSESNVQQREAIAVMNETLENLEEKVNDLLEDALYSYVQRT